jgi:hypothetical protein
MTSVRHSSNKSPALSIVCHSAGSPSVPETTTAPDGAPFQACPGRLGAAARPGRRRCGAPCPATAFHKWASAKLVRASDLERRTD